MQNAATRYTRRRTKSVNLAVFAAMRRLEEMRADAKARGMLLCWRCRTAQMVGTQECGSCGAGLAQMEGNR